MNETSVRALFDRYETLFNLGLGGDVDLDAIASLYAPEFIGAAPASSSVPIWREKKGPDDGAFLIDRQLRRTSYSGPKPPVTLIV